MPSFLETQANVIGLLYSLGSMVFADVQMRCKKLLGLTDELFIDSV